MTEHDGARAAPGPTVPVGATWEELAPLLRDTLAGGADRHLVVATSGSSGTPKLVRLSGTALRASGQATAEVLGSVGRWILALPSHHVAGLQVLARSVLAGTTPVALDPASTFSAAGFAAAVAAAASSSEPVYASLVPTQLHRLVHDPSGVGRSALHQVDAVLLGGAAADPSLLRQARAHTRVVTTYGMSETCGGCVYDGAPLTGVRVRIDPVDHRIELGGTVLADGYPDQPRLTAERFILQEGVRWFRTDDRGVWRQGRLEVLGRVDDVIVTGGHKVEPRDVEVALRALPGVGEALVLGLPDPEWGQVVAALLTPDAGPDTRLAPQSAVPAASPGTLEEVRAALADRLPGYALPRRLRWRGSIPLLPSGKPDRAAATTLLGPATS